MNFNIFNSHIPRPNELGLDEKNKTNINKFISDLISLLDTIKHSNDHGLDLYINGYTTVIQKFISDARITELNKEELNVIKSILMDAGWEAEIIPKNYSHNIHIALWDKNKKKPDTFRDYKNF